MTPVQKSVIPLFLSHKDVVVEAMTGSGKTLAFGIPLLETLLSIELSSGTYGLIIAPTRELATQIHGVLSTFVSNISSKDIQLRCCIGGNEASEDIESIKKGAHLVVGTPGRILDLLSKGHLVTKNLQVLVMDEADRLLDMGFEKTLNAIIQFLPKQRRTGLFSATMSEGFSELVRTGLRNPVKIVVKVQSASGEIEQRTPSSLTIQYLYTPPSDKLAHLLHLFKTHANQKLIVYLSTCASVDYFYTLFQVLRWTKSGSFYALHGKMAPKVRESVYSTFLSASQGILLCTDVAARGLDFPDIDLVVQFDPPTDPKSFAHRCGRSGRSGREGAAIVFLSPCEDTYVHFLTLRNVPLLPYLSQDQEDLDESMDINEETEDGSMEITKEKPFLFSHYSVGPSAIENRIRDHLQKDRALYESSLRAFVSFVRSYQAHQAHLIFRFKDLDVLGYVRMFGLLSWPRMPEFKGMEVSWKKEESEMSREDLKNVKKFEKHLKCDTEFPGPFNFPGNMWHPIETLSIPFRDKIREKKRLSLLDPAVLAKSLEKQKEKERKPKASSAWSGNKLAKEKRTNRQMKRQLKKLAILESRQPVKAKESREDLEDDLTKDYQELKREKR